MKNNSEKPKMDWTDYKKLTSNQKAALMAHKILSEGKSKEVEKMEEKIIPNMTRAERLRTIAFKSVMERRKNL